MAAVGVSGDDKHNIAADLNGNAEKWIDVVISKQLLALVLTRRDLDYKLLLTSLQTFGGFAAFRAVGENLGNARFFVLRILVATLLLAVVRCDAAEHYKK